MKNDMQGRIIIELVCTPLGMRAVLALGEGPRGKDELAELLAVETGTFEKLLRELEKAGVAGVEEGGQVTLKNKTALEFAKSAAVIPEKHRKTLLDMGLFRDEILGGIIETLEDGPIVAEELAEKLNAPLGEVQERLDKLVRAGIVGVDANARDRYCLEEANSL